MNSKLTTFVLASTLVLLVGGCATTPPPAPRVAYPVTYQIDVSNAQVRSDYGPQNLNVSATQEVAAPVGRPLYYQVVSPVDVTTYVYEKSSPTNRRLVGQMQGTTFTGSVTPTVSPLEFVFSAAQANTRGTMQFTLSDRPIAPAVQP